MARYKRVCCECGDIKDSTSPHKEGVKCKDCYNKWKPANNGVPDTHFCRVCNRGIKEVNFSVSNGYINHRCNKCRQNGVSKEPNHKKKEEVVDEFKKYFKEKKYK